jgi:hypothetical protein
MLLGPRTKKDFVSLYDEQLRRISCVTGPVFTPRFPRSLPVLLSDYRETMRALSKAEKINLQTSAILRGADKTHRSRPAACKEPECLLDRQFNAAAIRVAREYCDGAFRKETKSFKDGLFIKTEGIVPARYVFKNARAAKNPALAPAEGSEAAGEPIIVLADRGENLLLKASWVAAWTFAAVGSLCIQAFCCQEITAAVSQSLSGIARWMARQNSTGYLWSGVAAFSAAAVSLALQIPVRLSINKRERLLCMAEEALFSQSENPYKRDAHGA